MSEEYILKMEKITKTFPGVLALDGVSLYVKPGTVHALMGENGAGKSTLMKCLFGIYLLDSGKIIFKGKEVKFRDAKDALETGISMIHQELLNVPQRTVAQNIWLGRGPLRKNNRIPLIDKKKMLADTVQLFAQLGIEHIAPHTPMKALSIAEQQLCEIAKAVSYNASVVVMDEPTSSLSEREVAHLFKIVNDLRAKGVAIIFISHRMNEVFQIADEITVMRDGAKAGTYNARDLNEDALINLMIGRVNKQRFPPLEVMPGEVCLRVQHLTSENPASFKDVSFDLRKSEILGLGGLVGAQRTELVESLFGLRKIKSGRIEINGKEISIRTPHDAIKNKIGLITEDRRGSGIFPLLSITTNTAIAGIERYLNKLHLINHKKLADKAADINKQLKTKMPSMRAAIKNLSGGNQQKVIVGRYLMISPDILIMDEPTRGIDVGAKYEIYTIMAELIKAGKSIIMVSSEMPELLGMSTRVAILCDGKLTGILDKKDATQSAVMRLATQFS